MTNIETQVTHNDNLLTKIETIGLDYSNLIDLGAE